MNKIGFLLISIFLWTPCLCAEELSARVDRAFAEQMQAFLGVYPEVRRHLTSYYQREDFQDLDRSSGWYRVDEFLQWVAQNEDALKKSRVSLEKKSVSLPSLYLSEDKENHKIFWGYLGVRYAFARYGLNPKKLKGYTFRTCSEDKCYSNAKKNTITLGQLPTEDYVAFFNIALHEAVHLFSTKARQWDYMYSLPETAACKGQNLWALPVKSSNPFFAGVRDWRTLHDKGVSAYILQHEYAACVTAPFYGTEIFETKKDFAKMSFCDLLKSGAVPALWSEKQRVSADEQGAYLQEFFGEELWEKKLTQATENHFASLGVFSHMKVNRFYKHLFTQETASLSSDDQKEEVKQLLSLMPDGRHLALLYKQGSKVWFAFFPEEDFYLLPDEKIEQRFAQTEKAQQEVLFYKQLLRVFYDEDFQCAAVVPHAVKLLDQMTGAQSRFQVPQGYI